MAMNMDDLATEYLHDRPSDRGWRRFGLWLYLAACVVPMALVPRGAAAPAWSVHALGGLPALRGLLAASLADGRIVVWILASVLAYPLMHLCGRSRVYRQPRGPRWKAVLAVLAIDTVLFGALWLDLAALRGNRIASLVRDALLSDGPAMIVMAAILSAMYAFVLFLNIHGLSIAFSRPGQQEWAGKQGNGKRFDDEFH